MVPTGIHIDSQVGAPKTSEVSKAKVSIQQQPHEQNTLDRKELHDVVKHLRESVENQQQKLQESIQELDAKYPIFNSTLTFNIDKQSGRTIIRIVDNDTDEIIREIPPENLLKVTEKLSEFIGLLVDAKV